LLPVRLNVYDVGGRVVRGLIDGRMAAGVHGIRWDGCDDRGRELPAGSYFCRFECGQTKQTKRLVLMR
jgi:flagellar hook assembly protein FlgD